MLLESRSPSRIRAASAILLSAVVLTACSGQAPTSPTSTSTSAPGGDLTPSGTTLRQGQSATVLFPTTDAPPKVSKLRLTVVEVTRFYPGPGEMPQNWPYCLDLKVMNVGTGPSHTDGFSESMKMYLQDGSELYLIDDPVQDAQPICDKDVDPGSPKVNQTTETNNKYANVIEPTPPAKVTYENGKTRITWLLNKS